MFQQFVWSLIRQSRQCLRCLRLRVERDAWRHSGTWHRLLSASSKRGRRSARLLTKENISANHKVPVANLAFCGKPSFCWKTVKSGKFPMGCRFVRGGALIWAVRCSISKQRRFNFENPREGNGSGAGQAATCKIPGREREGQESPRTHGGSRARRTERLCAPPARLAERENFSPNNLMLNEIALLCFRAPAKREAVFGVAAGDPGRW